MDVSLIYFHEKGSTDVKEESHPSPKDVPAQPGGVLLHGRRSLRHSRTVCCGFVVVFPFQSSWL